MICGLIAAMMVLSLVPPTDRDGLTHHLYVPKLYLKYGGMIELPAIEFSYYPMNLDLLYIIPLYFGNDILPKFIHMMFGLFSAAFVYRYLSKRISSEMALVGAAFFLSTPVVFRLSITVYVDLGLMFFSFASLFYLFEWAKNRFRWQYLFLAGLSCGLALGTKYNGLVVFFLLAAAVPMLYSRISRIDADRTACFPIPLTLQNHFKINIHSMLYGFVFILVALIFFSPWAIRNMVWQGNPLYPLYTSAFVSQNAQPDVMNTENQPIGRLLKRKLLYDETLMETLTTPIRIFFQGQDDNPQYFDGKLNPLLAILPLFTLCNRLKKLYFQKTEEAFLAFFSILLVMFAFVASDMRIRYVAPIIAPLVVLSVMGIQDIQSMLASRFPAIAKRYGVWITACICMAFLFPNILYIQDQFKKVDPFPYILGRISRDAYIQRYRPEYAVVQFINRNLKDKAVVLAMFLGGRGYYFDREVRFEDGRLHSMAKKAASAGEMSEELNQTGITHLLIHQFMFNQWVADSLNERETSILKALFQDHLHLMFAFSGFSLFEINHHP